MHMKIYLNEEVNKLACQCLIEQQNVWIISEMKNTAHGIKTTKSLAVALHWRTLHMFVFVLRKPLT